jgi:hypothetical protein
MIATTRRRRRLCLTPAQIRDATKQRFGRPAFSVGEPGDRPPEEAKGPRAKADMPTKATVRQKPSVGTTPALTSRTQHVALSNG